MTVATAILLLLVAHANHLIVMGRAHTCRALVYNIATGEAYDVWGKDDKSAKKNALAVCGDPKNCKSDTGTHEELIVCRSGSFFVVAVSSSDRSLWFASWGFRGWDRMEASVLKECEDSVGTSCKNIEPSQLPQDLRCSCTPVVTPGAGCRALAYSSPWSFYDVWGSDAESAQANALAVCGTSDCKTDKKYVRCNNDEYYVLAWGYGEYVWAIQNYTTSVHNSVEEAKKIALKQCRDKNTQEKDFPCSIVEEFANRLPSGMRCSC